MGLPASRGQASAGRWTAGRRRGTKAAHEPARRHEPESRAAAGAARRTPAADDAGRGFGPGASDRTGRGADAPARVALARLDDLLGAAGQRQDDGRAADRRSPQRCVRAGLGHPYRRRGIEEDLRGRSHAPRARAGHAPVRRRDPSLQSRAAGFLPARNGGRLDHADRRDDRESFIRAQRVAVVARPRARLSPARARGARGAAEARRARNGQALAARRRQRARRSSAWRTATAARS